jgi:uncharacterized membrane protein YgdD (TMEM256/DUF423 family)
VAVFFRFKKMMDSSMQAKQWLMVAALCAFTAVAVGAFAAHGLKAVLSVKELAWLDTASRYQMYHALALLAVATLQFKSVGSQWLQVSACCFVGGILLFCGSLYALAFISVKWLVYVTPFGGLLFLIGWGALFFAAVKLAENTQQKV